MSPSNLGIVFGPTLLRPLVSTDMSMIALLETSYQAVLVEFLITHHDKIFGLDQSTMTPPAPTAPLPDTPPRASIPLDRADGDLDRDTSSKERPRSLEKRAFKRESSEGYISDKSSSSEAVDQLGPESNERAVLAVRASHLQGKPVGELASDFSTHPHYRFTRQPVKYYRHHNAGTRLSNLDCAKRQLACPKKCYQGSADSSHSSSPEPETQRCPQSLDVHSKNTQEPHQLTTTAEGRVDGPLSPREVVQYMLGLDSAAMLPAFATPSRTAEKSSEEVATWWQTDPNVSQNNSGHGAGQSHMLWSSSPKSVPTEHSMTSPAQKILSGLKPRRSHSGRDEQLFV